MKSLPDSTDIATIFFDNNLHVKRFTASPADLTPLVEGKALHTS